MAQWKKLTTLAVFGLVAANRAGAEVQFSPIALDSQSVVSVRPEAVGFDLSYRTVAVESASLASVDPFRAASLGAQIAEASSATVAAHEVTSAFSHEVELRSHVGVEFNPRFSFSVTPIPPAGEADEAVSTFGMFTQRWRRAVGSPSDGEHARAEAFDRLGRNHKAATSSAMPLVGITALSASAMGLLVGVRRKIRQMRSGQ